MHIVWRMISWNHIVDKLIIQKINELGEYPQDLTKEIKTSLLVIPVLDTWIDGKRSPLMNAVAATTTSLYRCYAGESRKLLYPEVQDGTI